MLIDRFLHFITKISGASNDKRRIYDCFIFHNEIELLKIRLNYLYDYVDKFVLVEATKTFLFKPKPLFFLENKNKFQDFCDKIIHVIVEDLPSNQYPRQNERHQRNAIFRGLSDCRDYDVVIVSDVDEIPNISVINHYLTHNLYTIKKLDQKLFYYYFNNQANSTWRLAFISSFYFLKNKDLTKIRKTKAKPKNVLSDAGWHFSYMGGIDAILKKLDALCHTDLNIPKYRNRDRLETILKTGEDLFGRPGHEYQFIEIDDTFPSAIRKNQEYYRQIGWIKD